MVQARLVSLHGWSHGPKHPWDSPSKEPTLHELKKELLEEPWKSELLRELRKDTVATEAAVTTIHRAATEHQQRQ